jgi:hypothetical protein
MNIDYKELIFYISVTILGALSVGIFIFYLALLGDRISHNIKKDDCEKFGLLTEQKTVYSINFGCVVQKNGEFIRQEK